MLFLQLWHFFGPRAVLCLLLDDLAAVVGEEEAFATLFRLLVDVPDCLEETVMLSLTTESGRTFPTLVPSVFFAELEADFAFCSEECFGFFRDDVLEGGQIIEVAISGRGSLLTRGSRSSLSERRFLLDDDDLECCLEASLLLLASRFTIVLSFSNFRFILAIASVIGLGLVASF